MFKDKLYVVLFIRIYFRKISEWALNICRAFESKHVALASVNFRCLYLLFRSLVGEKYISGLPLIPLKPIHCILLSLVSIRWIFKLFG
jgi:hypothetical protein